MTDGVHRKEAKEVGDDADVRAVRTLMSESTPQTEAACAVAPRGNTVRANANNDMQRAPRQRSKHLPEPDTAAKTGEHQRLRKLSQMARAATIFCVHQVKSYRPERKRILWTSLVLMLLLKPYFVLGWSFAAIAAVVIYYFVVGGDAFWRKVLAIYGWLDKRWPVFARKIKLRAYVLGRKWDRVLLECPAGLADLLRGPDLRRLIAADAQHDAAMTDRLDRLHEDPAAGCCRIREPVRRVG